MTRRVRLSGPVDELKAAERVLKAALHDEETPTRDLAGIARELRMLLAAIAAAEPVRDKDVVDDLAARRKARRSG